MHITLRQLRIFEAVARHSSISRAAREMHLTQPAVSMQVRQLEEQIGLPLLEQIGKRQFLTEAGLELRKHAQRFAAHTLELKSAMEQLRGLQRGLLRVAVVSTANYFLPPLVAALTRTHPGMHVSLQVGNRESVLAALSDNRADLAVTGLPPQQEELASQDFMDNPLVVIAPPSHRLARSAHIPLQRLATETLVVREPGSGTRAALERHFAAHGVVCRTGCELSTNEAIKQAVQAGLGLAVVSAQTVELECQTRRLVILPVEGFPIIRRWYLVHRRDKRLSAAAVAFRDLLVEDRKPAPITPKPSRRAASASRASRHRSSRLSGS